MRLLLVEDSSRLRTHLGRGLKRAGFAVDGAADGEQGLYLAETNDYDVIVLDLMLPKLDGLGLLQELRRAGRDTHVLILTARDAVADRVGGLAAGADDYLTKPFAFAELVARVRALARRSYGRKDPRIRVGELELDTARRRLTRAGRELVLTAGEYALLELLALRLGEVVSRGEIERHVYDERVEPMSNVVDAAVHRLRKKIDRPGRPSRIETHRGQGYRLLEEEP